MPGSGLGRESQLGQVKVEANGPRERKEVGWAGWLGLGPLSFSILFQHTQTELNSNSNLNSTLALNQIKEMLQHDATTKIKPMINFNYLRNKIRLNVILNTINLRNLNKAS